jgi:hypothetical protein
VDDIMKMRKEFKIKRLVIVVSFLVIFVMPFVSFATSYSDFQLGYLDNTLKMSLDNCGSLGSGVSQNHRPSNVQGGQPQATPNPSAAWLLGTGLIGLFGISRKLKK